MKKHIPNTLTCCNLICGCIATCAGFHGQFMTAFLFIIFGAVFDFFDGFVARLLGVSGPMGVELDSLADVITFGLAPASMIFTLFTTVYYPEAMYSPFWFKVMPFTAFLMPAFAALRLAKFNIDPSQHDGFIGLPTPACALFWSALISSSTKYLNSPMFNAPFLFAFVLVFCLLMVSKVPMFNLRSHRRTCCQIYVESACRPYRILYHSVCGGDVPQGAEVVIPFWHLFCICSQKPTL